MRRGRSQEENYKVMVVDDDIGIIDSISILLKRKGYEYVGITNPVDAIEKLKNENYDLLILDYIMEPLNGDEVVEEIRKFNPDIYILFLTGHKDLAPPLETLENFDIQGYCEKSDKFDQLTLFIESAIKAIAQKRTINKFKDGLNRIIEAIPKIYQLQPIDDILKEILEHLMPLVYSSNAFILADDITVDSEDNKSIFNGIGTYNVDINTFMANLTFDFMGNIGKARTQNVIVELNEGIIIPLTIENNTNLGVIYIQSDNYKDGIKLLDIYAKQAAAAINNAYMHSIVNIKNDELTETYAELKQRYMDAIETLRLTVDAKDYYTRGHSDRVSYYSQEIGKAMNLSEEELEILKIGGIFHDIGKIGTNDDILLKNARLDDAEYTEIKKHPIKGANILSAMSMFRDVVPVVRYHHERYDGKGYPDGLKGEDIPLLARITSVADAFDAMTSDRVYRTKLDIEKAVEQLVLGKGTQFDPNIVDIFIKLLDGYDKMQEDLKNTYVGVIENSTNN